MCWGACSEELAVPYEPWIEICSQIIRHAPLELLSAHIERHGGELGRLARNLAGRVASLPERQSSDPETERYLLFSAVVGLLEQVAQRVPVCVVLDDLHWADGQSVALLKHLVRTLDREALQLIATYRDSDLGKDHPLSAVLADLRMVEGVQRIALRGLGVDEVAQLMTVVAGHELDQDGLDLAGQIAAETEGNPFFVGEILRGLSESGALSLDEASGRWRVDHSAGLGLPESVREVIERRVERLGEEAQEVLRFAAVIGRAFDLELLSHVVEVEEGRLLDHLEAAIAASLLSESTERVGEFRFAHALINQTLYEGLGATRRARMHQRVAQALEELHGADPPVQRLSELALHWRLAAVSVDRAKAADYASRAGERALESLAPDEAVKLFTDALELTDNVASAERCGALIGLGEAQRQVGHPGYRQTLLDAAALARELGDADRLCRAVLANSRGFVSKLGAVDSERVHALEVAAEAVEDDSRRARVLSLLALELHHGGDPARCRRLAHEAIEIARAADDPAVLDYTLNRAVFAIWGPEALKERESLADEQLDLAQRLDDPKLSFWAAQSQWDVGWEAGDRPRAASALTTMRTLAASVPEPTFAWQRLFYEGVAALMQGDLQAAEQWAIQAFEAGTAAGQPDALDVFSAQLFNVRYPQGRRGSSSSRSFSSSANRTVSRRGTGPRRSL